MSTRWKLWEQTGTLRDTPSRICGLALFADVWRENWLAKISADVWEEVVHQAFRDDGLYKYTFTLFTLLLFKHRLSRDTKGHQGRHWILPEEVIFMALSGQTGRSRHCILNLSVSPLWNCEHYFVNEWTFWCQLAQLVHWAKAWSSKLFGSGGQRPLLLLLVCVSFTIIGQPRNSVLICRV